MRIQLLSILFLTVLSVPTVAFGEAEQSSAPTSEATAPGTEITTIENSESAIVTEEATEDDPDTEDFSGDFSDFSSLDLEALLNTEVDIGSGFKKSLYSVPAVVEVLQAEEIARLGIRDLRELILHLTGTYETALGSAPLIHNTVLLRGGNVSDRILLLIDDHAALGELDEGYNPWSLPIEVIERVEFLRGPAAVLYGSSSMAGVVRVVTRKPEEGAHGGGTVLYDPVGNGGEVYARGSWAGILADHHFSTGLDVQARQTEELTNKLAKDDEGNSASHPMQVSAISALGTVRLGDFFTRLQFHISKSQIMGLAPRASFHTNPSRKQLIGVELGYRGMIKDWSLSVRQAVDIHDRDIDIGQLPPGDEANRTMLDFNGMVIESEASGSLQKENWSIRLGLQNRHLRTTKVAFIYTATELQNPLGTPANAGGAINDSNIYTQATYSPVKGLEFLAGGRLNLYKTRATDYLGLTPEELDPDPIVSPMGRVAAVWQPNDMFSGKFLYGRAFRLPTMIEMYSQVKTVLDPNPGLGPELQDTVEIAFNLQPVSGLSLRANGFLNIIKNGIAQDTNSPGISQGGRYVNGNLTYYTTGFDVTTKWVGTSWLHSYLSFTYHEGGFSNDVYLDEMPRTVGKSWITLFPLNDDRLQITPAVLHRGILFGLDPETTLNLTVLYKPTGWLTVQASSFNLFNEPIQHPYYTLAPDGSHVIGRQLNRTFRFGVSADF